MPPLEPVAPGESEGAQLAIVHYNHICLASLLAVSIIARSIPLKTTEPAPPTFLHAGLVVRHASPGVLHPALRDSLQCLSDSTNINFLATSLLGHRKRTLESSRDLQ